MPLDCVLNTLFLNYSNNLTDLVARNYRALEIDREVTLCSIHKFRLLFPTPLLEPQRERSRLILEIVSASVRLRAIQFCAIFVKKLVKIFEPVRNKKCTTGPGAQPCGHHHS